MSSTSSHGLPFVDASEVGMSAERLARIENHFKSYVDESWLSGWALTIAREGKIALSASCGLADRENNKPISDDTIYRIFSMTKPITAVAAMMLWEEGKFELHDHVSKFIPEFGESKVFLGGTFSRIQLV
jgi:CubicO group peptidase (beta-lactamase class C family)